MVLGSLTLNILATFSVSSAFETPARPWWMTSMSCAVRERVRVRVRVRGAAQESSAVNTHAKRKIATQRAQPPRSAAAAARRRDAPSAFAHAHHVSPRDAGPGGGRAG